MFTGIVEAAGEVVSFQPGANAWKLVVQAGATSSAVAAGDSVAVNGCCLTAVQIAGGQLQFDVLEETRRLTNFSALRPGSLVNLERSLRFDGKVGGHFVTGHIDGVGTALVFEQRLPADRFLSRGKRHLGRRRQQARGRVGGLAQRRNFHPGFPGLGLWRRRHQRG